jgi:hypothetical protein
LVLMNRGTEEHEPAGIAALRQVRRDLNRRRTHRKRSAEMAQHRGGVRYRRRSRTPARNVLREIPLQLRTRRHVRGLVHEVLPDRRSPVPEEQEQLVFHDRPAERTAELVPLQSV